MLSMDPALVELFEGGAHDEEVAAIIRLREAGLAPPAVRLVAQFGDIATCRLRRQDIPAVRAHQYVESLKAPRLYRAEPEIRIRDSAGIDPQVFGALEKRRPELESATGQGVVVAVIDWGCDFAHPNFRNPDGSTRLLALWDQHKPREQVDSDSPQPYGYGVLHTGDEINRALANPDPYTALRHPYHPADGDLENIGSHGTHVMDIAAGCGRVGSEGVAPGADLLFVDLAILGEEGLISSADPDRRWPVGLGNSVTLLEAADFVARTAAGRPCTCNCSFGRQAGCHDGSTLVEQGLDQLMEATPGLVFILSTGNYRENLTHAFGRVLPGGESVLGWETDEADVTPNEVDIWYSGHDRLIVELSAPDGTVYARAAFGEQAVLEVDGHKDAKIYHRGSLDPNNGDIECLIRQYPGAAAGRWKIRLIAEDVMDGRWHAWIERDAACRGCQSRFDPQDAVSTATTGTICNGYRTIAVGAYDSHSPTRELAHFSSSGPTRDGRQKPDLVAPGVGILAARSAPRDLRVEANLLTIKSGTSMAAPHVTGAMACVFQEAGRLLTIQETRRLLLASTTPPDAVITPETAARIGSGYLNIQKAVEAAQLERSRSTQPPTRTRELEWISTTERTAMQTETQIPEQEFLSVFDDALTEAFAEIVSATEDEPTPLAGRYAVVVGSRENGIKARDELLRIARTFWQRTDLKWAFPYVYGRVTDAVINSYDQGGFKGGDAVLHWVVNFYELFVLNLQSWVQSGKAESPWRTAFTEADKLLRDPSPWGARSAAAFILGMFAHIRSDLPRALAYVYLKFFRNLRSAATNRPFEFDDFKPDFDIMNKGVFPKVIEQIATDGVLLPSITNAWPGFRDSYLSRRLPLAQEREDAWQVGKSYAADAAVIASVNGLSMRRAPTVVSLEKPTKTEQVGDSLAQRDVDQYSARSNLVDLADEAISAGEVSRSSGSLLDEVVWKADRVETVRELGIEGVPSPASIFDSLAYQHSPGSCRYFEQIFEVVARPLQRFPEDLQPGDLLVDRALGEGALANVAMLVTGQALPREALPTAGLAALGSSDGYFVHVVEGGAFSKTTGDRQARRLADRRGRLGYDQMVLRPRTRGIVARKASELAEQTMIKKIHLYFAGSSFQCRLATDPMPRDASPRRPPPTPEDLSKGWTFAYGEKDFDRVIRLSEPVDLRNGMLEPWNDSVVAGIAVDRGSGLKTGFVDPVIGEVVSLGASKFQADPPGMGPGKEALIDFQFSIGHVLKADAKTIPLSPGLDPPKGNPELANYYLRNKPKRLAGLTLDPDRAAYLERQGMLYNYAHKYKYTGVFPGIELINVTLTGARGVLKEMGSANSYKWELNLKFYRFDGDTLTGSMSMDLFATRRL